jgi:hypothetical protein
MIILQIDGHGCVYSIDSEGTLYMTPISQSNSIRLDDWVEVESVDELDDNVINEIHEQLITLEKANGTYFQNA